MLTNCHKLLAICIKKVARDYEGVDWLYTMLCHTYIELKS